MTKTLTGWGLPGRATCFLSPNRLDRGRLTGKDSAMSIEHPLSRRFLSTCAALLLVSCLPLQAGKVVSEKESTPFPGIRVLERVTDEPNQIFAAFISLEESGLRIDATEPTRSLKSVQQWAEENGALLAVNGDFYRFFEGTPHVYGDAVGGGSRWPLQNTGRDETYSDQWFFNRYGWIAFGPDWVEHSYTREVKRRPQRYQAKSGWKPGEVTQEIPTGTQALVSGFSALVIDGEPIRCETPTVRGSCFPDRGDMHERHPRTAMGLTEDRKTFILVVVDGRRSDSRGMLGTELAELMHDLGAWVAINLDGGASSQMYLKGRGVINTPSATPHRRVLNHWGVFPAE